MSLLPQWLDWWCTVPMAVLFPLYNNEGYCGLCHYKTLQKCSFYPSSDLFLDTILSQMSAVSFLKVMAWFSL